MDLTGPIRRRRGLCQQRLQCWCGNKSSPRYHTWEHAGVHDTDDRAIVLVADGSRLKALRRKVVRGIAGDDRMPWREIDRAAVEREGEILLQRCQTRTGAGIRQFGRKD